MKPQHDFVAERPIAQHCAELFASEPSPEERAQEQAGELQVFATRLERFLQMQLVPQLGTPDLRISAEAAGKRKAGSLYKAIGAAAVNLLLECGEGRLPLLLSFDYGAALALTEQSFGGDVRGLESDLEELPRSAWLVLESLAAQIADGFAASAELEGQSQFLRCHENVAKLDAFAKTAPCLVWPITIHLPREVELPFRLVTPEPDFLDALAGKTSAEDAAQTPAPSPAQFAALPLPLHAVLAEMELPVARIASLKPGELIPFSPRREVPLMAGERMIAKGRIGTLDESVALNLTQLN